MNMKNKQKKFFKKKKGIVWVHIVELLLALMVLVIILTVVFPSFFPKSKEILFELIGLVNPGLLGRTEFTPYEPDLTEEEKSVVNSIDAFVCGVNSVAVQREAWINTQLCPSGFETQAPATPTGAITGFFTKVTGRVTEEVCSGITYGRVCLECSNEGTFTCKIKNFELPQEGEESLLHDFVAGLGDPEYLLYYEQFPEDQATFWNLDAFSIQPSMLFLGAAVSGVFPLGDDLKAAFKAGSAGRAIRSISEYKLLAGIGRAPSRIFRAMTSFNKIFLRENAEGAAKKNLIKWALLKSNEIIMDPDNADEALEIVSKYVKKGRLVGSQAGLEDDLITFFKRNLDDMDSLDELGKARHPFARETITERAELYKLNPGLKGKSDEAIRELAKRDIARDYARTYARNIQTELGRSLSKDQIEKITMKNRIANIFRNFRRGDGTIDEKLFKKFLEDNGKNLDEMIKLLDNNKLKPDQIGRMIGTAAEVASEYPADKWIYLSRQFEKQLAEQSDDFARLMGTNDDAIGAITDKVLAIVNKVPIAGKPTVLAARGLEQANKHRILTIIGLGLIANGIDSTNEKFDRAGKDTLVLNIPNWIGPNVDHDLKAAKAYALILQDEDNNPQRFHLVSPCKADLTLTRELIASKMDDINSVDLFDFGGGFTPVKKGTIIYDEIISQSAEKLQDIEEANTLFEEANDLFSAKKYLEAIQKYNELIETYPESNKVNDGRAKIGSILLDFTILRTLDVEKLKQVAFEERLSKEERAKYYSPSFKEGTLYSDTECDTKEEYLTNLESCDRKISQQWNGDFETTLRLIFLRYFVPESEIELELFQFNDYWKRIESSRQYVEATYKLPFLYISGFLLNVKPEDLQSKLNFLSPSMIDLIVDNDVSGKMQNPFKKKPYQIGIVLVPKHLKSIKQPFLGTELLFIPTIEDYSEFTSYTKTLEDDSYFDDDTFEELIFKKIYYEYKFFLMSYAEKEREKDDLLNWITINKKLQDEKFSGKLDVDKAVKLTGHDYSQNMATYFQGKKFSYAGINIKADLDSELDPNYCFHGSHKLLETIKWGVFAISFVADKAAGAAAGAACAPSVVGAPICARAAMVATNLALGFFDAALYQQAKWPKH